MTWDLCRKTNEFLFIHIIHFFMACFQNSVFAPCYKVTAGFCLTLGEHFEIAQPSLDPSALQDSRRVLSTSLAYMPLSIHVLQSVIVTSLFDCKVQISGRISCIVCNSLGHTVRPGQCNSRPTADCHHRLPVLWEIGSWSFWGTLKSLLWLEDH